MLLPLQRATHRTLHVLAAALADLDLTPSEINTLANLSDGRARSVRELAADTGTRATTLTGVLDRLERRGHLTRQLDPADRRSFRLCLTDSGQAVAARVRDAVTGLEHDALAGLSADQLAGYHAVVSALQEVR
ncbi:MarR family winged helix-turn-helix transcriptional regulator [Rugosimonospora africana]|uniref:MarR family winged helix-turn-helix transcriptional regulator n=1 Tax=Rugosimonospora africana TaxID=556532 RepID=UPI0019448FCE|nr:MarR family transcriptional regulator [Rugosimonospora africana]